MTGVGDNSVGVAADQLKSYIERVERLTEDKAAVQADIKQVFDEAKSAGFDPKIMRAIIKERAHDAQERQEFEALMDTYRAALGMLDGTPLGQAAVVRLATKS